MKQVYLLKEHQGHNANSIISVSNNVAFGLIENGTARKIENRDFLVKPNFGETKAFNDSPQRGRIKIKKKYK